jgi:hypothetical protein
MDDDNKIDLINTSITFNSIGKNNVLFSNQKAPLNFKKDHV